MCIIKDKAANGNLLTADAELRLAVEKDVNVRDQNRFPAPHGWRSRVIVHCEAKRLGLMNDLRRKIRGWRDVDCRPLSFVQATLENQQAHEGLPATRVHLDAQVRRVTARIPLLKNFGLNVSKVPVLWVLGWQGSKDLSRLNESIGG